MCCPRLHRSAIARSWPLAVSRVASTAHSVAPSRYPGLGSWQELGQCPAPRHDQGDRPQDARLAATVLPEHERPLADVAVGPGEREVQLLDAPDVRQSDPLEEHREDSRSEAAPERPAHRARARTDHPEGCESTLHTGGRLEDIDPLAVVAGDLADGGLAGLAALLPFGQRLPEGGAADGEADEARDGRGGREPVADLLVVFAPAQDDAADLVAAAALRGRDDLRRVLRRSSPSIFQTSGSTPASWSAWIACTISPGRSSRSYRFLSPPAFSSWAFSAGTSSSNMNLLGPPECRYSDSRFSRSAWRRFIAASPSGL